MKKYILLLCLCLGCHEEAESNAHSTNHNVKVERLFKTDGCTVYRFEDGNLHYFARCEDSITVSEAHTRSCGKNCRRTEWEEIPTVTGGAEEK